jgi:hypothetical protein
MIHTSEKIRRRNYVLSQRMDRLLQRIALDRQLLIKDKIDSILGKADGPNLRKIVRRNKLTRSKLNRK